MTHPANVKSTTRVFLDTSALFAGIWSPSGGARLIFQLGEAGALQIVVSPQVLGELEIVLRRKAPGQLGDLALLLDRIQIEVSRPASEARRLACLQCIHHPGDAQVAADDWEAQVAFLVTLDQQHFLNNPQFRDQLPFPCGTPGDFLTWYKQRFPIRK